MDSSMGSFFARLQGNCQSSYIELWFASSYNGHRKELRQLYAVEDLS